LQVKTLTKHAVSPAACCAQVIGIYERSVFEISRSPCRFQLVAQTANDYFLAAPFKKISP
jgi:hypothetical protein